MSEEERTGEPAPPVDGETKLGALLDRWPAAEAALRALSPRFGALEVPVVRKAFTRAATLRQVAAAAGISSAELFAALRAAGVPIAAPAGPEPPAAAPPEWAAEARVTAQRDARADVAAGIHPLPLVLEDLEALADADVYRLITPFLPAPLIDLARKKGYEAWSPPPAAEGPVRTYFRRRVGGAAG